MTTTQVFKSTDTGAPSMAGQTGKVIAILDAVLVDGYNSQTITSITRSGSTATASKTAHGFRDGAVLLHAGADQAEYNVKAKITVVDANTYTYPVSGTPATPATGALTAKVAPAGWSKVFSGTNKAVYRPPQGNRFYLRALDDGSDATNTAKVAMFRGYETMSDVDTGTAPFPTVAQLATGLFIAKSSTADATARTWTVQADEKRLVFHVAPNAGATTAHGHWGFGDLVGASSADPYASFAFGWDSSASAVVTPGNLAGRGSLVGVSPATNGLYVARPLSGAVGAYAALPNFPCTASNGSGYSGFEAPLTNGDIMLDPVLVANGATTSNTPRGRFPGVLYCRNYLDTTYVNGTKFGQYEVLRSGTSGGQCYLIDAGDWE